MQTHFSQDQLADPVIREANGILRACVHCGFCLSACPTYALLGDERDSPRGRIYLIKDMLESSSPPTPDVVRHVDRCLSCLACMSACPSGVHYQHYVDHARAYIEAHYRRPVLDRALRALIGAVLPAPGRMRAALAAAGLARPLARPFAALLGRRLAKMLALAPRSLPPAPSRATVYPAEGARRMRVALLTGCVQEVVRPQINDAAIRLLTRLGCEVAVAPGAGCCGSLNHHLGQADSGHDLAQANVAAWSALLDEAPLDAVISTASGCGTTLKDYGHMLGTPEAERIAGLARDVTEVVAELAPLSGAVAELPLLAYHDACSLRHGQGITAPPRELLRQAGFEVRDIAEPGMCCGSAGSYNMLEPAIAEALGARKAENIGRTGAAAVATGNIGCLVQLRGGLDIPVAHTVELLDWATGGPRPDVLEGTG